MEIIDFEEYLAWNVLNFLQKFAHIWIAQWPYGTFNIIG